MEFKVRNVNQAISEALWCLKVCGVKEQSRNGSVIVFPEPVITTYEKPQERVLFWSERDASPIFHTLECLWILAGRRDVEFVKTFNSRINAYSDDGENFNAAYGYRMRHHWGEDQLVEAIRLLKRDPNTRRCVIQLYDARDLSNQTSKDHACNTQLYFDRRGGRLNLTVCCRSNDLWWGAFGANAVHFSFIQEFVASAVGVPMGIYRQFSNNLHLYGEQVYDAQKYLNTPPDPSDYDEYRRGIKPRPIMDDNDHVEFLNDCELFCDDPFYENSYYHSFFKEVAYPMAMVSKTRKDKAGDGRVWAAKIQADDWRLATEQWIDRRENAKGVQLKLF